MLLSYPSRHSGVDPLFELWVCGEAVPHDVRGVVFVSQLWATLKQEVYDKEFDAPIHAWNREGKKKIKWMIFCSSITTHGYLAPQKIGATKWCSRAHVNQSHTPHMGKRSFACVRVSHLSWSPWVCTAGRRSWWRPPTGRCKVSWCSQVAPT